MSYILPVVVAVSAAAVAAYVLLASSKSKRDTKKLSRQSVEASGSASRGESRPRRNADLGESKPLTTVVAGGKITTLYELMSETVNRFPQSNCLGSRKMTGGVAGAYEFKSYRTVYDRILNFSSGLQNLGARPNDTVGIYSKNREEWILTEHACYAASLVIVSFYDSLGEDAVGFIARHADTKFIVASKEVMPKLVKTVEQIQKSGRDLVKYVIQMESDIDPKQKEDFASSGATLLSFEEIEQQGKANPRQPVPPKPADLSTIMYTSGTTGDPKGVMLTHANVIAALSGAEKVTTEVFGPGDHYLSYLPLAHIFERVVLTGALFQGAAVGFSQGDVRKLVEDIQELKPSLLTGVPRVFDRIYDKVRATIDQSGGLRQRLFAAAYNAKKNALQNGVDTPFWNILVFNKLKQRLGGKVRAILSGSAPLTPAVHEFLLVCFGCPVIQGYGLTETCAGTTLALLDDTTVNHVGPPIQCCEIKLVDVPEMEYLSSNDPPRGEVVIRGAQVSLGYYKDEKKTAEEFRDGWFYSGDIGQWNPNGTLSIIDRKKNIFKLSQGEYIAAEKLEGVFKGSKYVAQIFVYGDSTRSTLIALVVPDPERVAEWAKSNNVSVGDLTQPAERTKIYDDPKLVDTIFNDMTAVGKSAKLRGFEFIKKIKLLPEDFSIENDQLTPTFKLKRPQLKKRYQNVIDQLYAGIKE